MSGGGGGGTTKSDVTTTTSNLPEYAEPYYHDLLARTGFETAQPYETYDGPRVADFSPYEQEAMARMGDLGMSGDNQYLQAAGNVAGGIAGMQAPGVGYTGSNDYVPGAMGNAGQYNAGSRDSGYVAGQRDMGFEAGQLNDPEMIQSYMSPYMQNVVDIQKREAMRDADVRHRDTGMGAASQGALGG